VTSRATVVALALAAAALLVAHESAAGSPLRVGSKRFTESYILAEIAVQTARAHGEPTAVHVQGLGATAIAFKALEDGEIDLYPDYTGSIAETLFHGDAAVDAATLTSALAARGLGILGPLGFENTYALAVRADFVSGDATISGLKRRGDLVVGVSHEFLGRSDGWPGLAARYGLVPREVRAMDHGLAYAALVDGQVDVVDAYSTDAKIAKYGLVLLGDDRHFFPSYEATFLYRRDAEAAHPEAFTALSGLRGAIGVDAMRTMNGQAELDGRSFADVASGFLAGQGSRPTGAANHQSLLARLGRSIVRYGPRHVALTAIALVFATVVGILFGIVGARRPLTGSVILGITGVVQTIPSLALLCLFIPLFGIGVVPTLVALFVYGLLPITRNTLTALNEIPAPTRESAQALGLTPWETLRVIELPLASRSILAGIKTSAVLTVGTATVAAFIGAGGFGEPISVGLNLNDTPTILEGAIPAALLALVVQGLFALVDRAVVPRGLRVATARTESGRARPVG
jgi:osmoprotectant transport system permease protein